MANTFTRITSGIATEQYITKIENGRVYYGYYKAGHENKCPTACMTLAHFNKLKNKEQHGTLYIEGCTHGRSIPISTMIIA